MPVATVDPLSACACPASALSVSWPSTACRSAQAEKGSKARGGTRLSAARESPPSLSSDRRSPKNLSRSQVWISFAPQNSAPDSRWAEHRKPTLKRQLRRRLRSPSRPRTSRCLRLTPREKPPSATLSCTPSPLARTQPPPASARAPRSTRSSSRTRSSPPAPPYLPSPAASSPASTSSRRRTRTAGPTSTARQRRGSSASQAGTEPGADSGQSRAEAPRRRPSRRQSGKRESTTRGRSRSRRSRREMTRA